MYNTFEIRFRNNILHLTKFFFNYVSWIYGMNLNFTFILKVYLEHVPRVIIKTMPNISNGALCKSCKGVKALTYFRKQLHHRSLPELWTCLYIPLSNIHVKFALTPCAFHFVKTFHSTNIQSAYCLYLQNRLELFR